MATYDVVSCGVAKTARGETDALTSVTAVTVRGAATNYGEVDDVRDHIQKSFKLLGRLPVSVVIRQRAVGLLPIPIILPTAARAVAIRAWPWSTQVVTPRVPSGEHVTLVRPYLLAREPWEEWLRRQRWLQLWLAVNGVDANPRCIHGVEVSVR